MSIDVTPSELMHEPETPGHPTPLSPWQLWIMSAACGVSAANIYYNQPLLKGFEQYFHATAPQAGMVATAAQVGYGVGLLFFVPLGDVMDRRKVVLGLSGLCMLFLIGAATAHSLTTLIVMQLLIGITAMSAQLLIPFAVDLTPIEQRGKTVGSLMTGLLTGLLLARTVSGIVSDHFGWRAMFWLGAAVVFLLVIVLSISLPHRPPTARMSYGRLMHSMLELVETQPKLWTASLISALSFGTFSAFWATLSFLMAERFGRGATEAGAFGVIGLVGALAAPLAGRLSDKRGSNFTVAIALLVTLASFVLMWGWLTIPGLIVGVVLMDLGVQSIQVAEQSKVMALVPHARSRINTVYMVARFIGGAAGSQISLALWPHFHWTGVCVLCVAAQGASFGVHWISAGQNRPHAVQPA